MNRTEFADWLDYHSKAYPGLKAWLAKTEGQDDFWFNRLRDISLASARQATNELHTRDEQPKGYADHPRVIYRIASDSPSIVRDKPQYIGGQQVFRCSRCEDSGFVSALSPATLKALWRNDREHSLRWCAIACDCDTGDRRVRAPQRKRIGQWRDGHALFSYLDVVSNVGRGDDEWDVAREMLTDYDSRVQVRVSTTDDVQLQGGYAG